MSVSSSYTLNSSVFAQVYDRYWKRMYNLAFHYTQDNELAKEIVQTVFESLWKRWETFTVEEWLEAYLLKAIRLQVAAHYRKQAARQQHLEQIRLTGIPSDHTTDNQIVFSELTQRVTQLVEQLPGQRRRVFELSRWQGLTNREIAAELTLAEKTVENHLTHALQYLRKRLTDYL
ncbi:RNA polymerase sigma-70 factor [Spirosoma sp. RP8]|uniref:RNA polymerase sigma-70 factor n=1 Tax=Spirosoma liriopis TaxID=2937440 RepID=A0ABT0HRJ0_9BACT|nr:RNA polymerase sigma-70 factor [Spirosoma liriopis]MCK8494786.1 RNA polymerase sigma-70 factor [Spirosoma liriopis]